MIGLHRRRQIGPLWADCSPEARDNIDHRFDVDGLGQVVVETCECGTSPRFPVAQGGSCNKEKRTGASPGLQLCSQFESIHGWHHEIEQANVRLELGGDSQGGLAIITGANRATQQFQDSRQGVGGVRVIVNHEDAKLSDWCVIGIQNVADAIFNAPGDFLHAFQKYFARLNGRLGWSRLPGRGAG